MNRLSKHAMILLTFASGRKARRGGGKRRKRSRPSGGGRRWLITIAAILIGLALGYFLPDYAPRADQALRQKLGLKTDAAAGVAPIEVAEEEGPFVLPEVAEGDWLAEHLPFGRPRGECDDCTEIIREAYVVLHDNSRKIPRWVAWRLDPEDTRHGVSRSDDFREDPLVPEHGRAKLSDYRGSGLDRGHVAPAADVKKSRTTMSESFFLSNMMPQTPRLNRQEWRMLEERTRDWLGQRHQLWIISGPGFVNGDSSTTIGDGVHVPTHCWKIVIDQLEDGTFETLAVWMENIERDVPNWQKSQVTIDEIEEYTGLDFLPALPDSIEDELETRMDEW